MPRWWLDLPDTVRAGVAIAICIALFTSDLVTAVNLNESQLYPVALLAVYRVKSRTVVWTVAVLAGCLTVAGYLLAPPPDIWDQAVNRTFSIVGIAIITTATLGLADYEHKLLLESITDPLTGLLNRRHFEALARKEESRARRHRQEFAVLMLDIDHFKRINDTYGHPVGDLAIKALAATCAKALRPHDILARYGGEEFVLTLPQTGLEGAGIVAERIRQSVEQVVVPSEQGEVRFTVSIGISVFAFGARFETVLQRADEALYQAKQGGRNRVVGLLLDGGSAPVPA